MIDIITVPPGSSFFETSLGGEVVNINMYYSKSQDRYIMDIENKRTKMIVTGLGVNVGVDILGAAGRVGLEALMLVSTPQPFLEGGIENFENNLQLVYMDLETYNQNVLLGGESRVKWNEETPNAL